MGPGGGRGQREPLLLMIRGTRGFEKVGLQGLSLLGRHHCGQGGGEDRLASFA